MIRVTPLRPQDFGDLTDGRLVSPSIASAAPPLTAAYAGEGKEQEGEREEEALMPVTVKVNKVNGEAAGRGVETANGGSGIADKSQPAATAATRPGEAVPVDDAGLDRVSEAKGCGGGSGIGWTSVYAVELCLRRRGGSGRRRVSRRVRFGGTSVSVCWRQSYITPSTYLVWFPPSSPWWFVLYIDLWMSRVDLLPSKPFTATLPLTSPHPSAPICLSCFLFLALVVSWASPFGRFDS